VMGLFFEPVALPAIAPNLNAILFRVHGSHSAADTVIAQRSVGSMEPIWRSDSGARYLPSAQSANNGLQIVRSFLFQEDSSASQLYDQIYTRIAVLLLVLVEQFQVHRSR